jgi:hypothetical protein
LKLKQGSSFWIHSVFFTLLNRSFLIAFGVVSYIILAKKVFPTVKEMGIWALSLAIFALIENIKHGLLRNPMIKFLSDLLITSKFYFRRILNSKPFSTDTCVDREFL